MRTSAADVWQTVHAERRRLVGDLAELSDDQWRRPSLCPGWTVHDVVAHLVDTALTSRLVFVREMLRARLDFDRANHDGVVRQKRPDPRETLDALAAVADLRRTPPAALATRLVEAIVHGEDVRRPLGLTGAYPPHAVSRALTYQLRTAVSFGGGRERAAGLRLVDVRTGATWGTGDDVEAEPLDLLRASAGRPVDPHRVNGRGARRLTGDEGSTPDAPGGAGR